MLKALLPKYAHAMTCVGLITLFVGNLCKAESPAPAASIKDEFASVANIRIAALDFFLHFSARSLAVFRRLELQGVNQFRGESDVWRVYYATGSAAHSIFPEYYRIKRELWRRELDIESADIQYNQLSEDTRQKNDEFLHAVGKERREGMSPKYTSQWNHSTLSELRDQVIRLDKDAIRKFDEKFTHLNYMPDYSHISGIVDATIRTEDRAWLYHRLGIDRCLKSPGPCHISSELSHRVAMTLWNLKDDPVLNEYFPDLTASICDISEDGCNYSAMMQAVDAMKEGATEDRDKLLKLTIGQYFNFGWGGPRDNIPITRLLCAMPNETLKTIYKQLLDDRDLWRFIKGDEGEDPTETDSH